MSVYPSIPATLEIGRGRFFGLVTAVAVLAAAVTWILVAVAFDSGSTSTASTGVQVAGPGSATSAAQDARKVPSIMSLTAADLAAHALGTGYALPSARTGPSVQSVLASMSPQTRAYTKRIMNLTFAQLAAGAAGRP